MNAIQKAIDELHFTIPKQILQLAFVSRHDAIWKVSSTGAASIDAQILNQVIRPRVLVDCDLVGGTQAMIPLNSFPLQSHDGVSSIIHIPKTASSGRSITSVLHVAFLSAPYQGQSALSNSVMASTGFTNQAVTATTTTAAAIVASYDTIPIISTARVELISENTILVRDIMALQSNAVLRCVIANEANMENIQIRSYRTFAKLCGFAVKSYIYNLLDILLGETALLNGMQLDAIKNQLEKYSDAEANYQDFLTNEWEAAAFFNDTTSTDRFLRLITGGNH
jgi:hypothetical protein